MKYLKPLPFILIPLIWILYMGGVPSCRTNYAVEGLEAYQKEDYQAAADALTKAIDSGIKNEMILGEVYYYRAMSWLILQDFNRCAADAEQLIRMAPSGRGYVLRGSAMAMLNRHDLAVADFTTALAKGGLPEKAVLPVLLARAQSYVPLEQWDSALSDLNVLIKAGFEEAEARSVRARVWMAKEQWEKCFADSERAVILGADEVLVGMLQIPALMNSGRNTEAVAKLDRVITLMENTEPSANLSDQSKREQLVDLYRLRASMNLDLGKPQESLADLQKAINLGVKLGYTYATRCGHWEILGEDEKGIADADKAIELGERTAHVYLNRAVCLQRLGRLEEANQDWGQAMTREPRSDLPHFYRGLAYAYDKDYAQAVSCWRDGIDLHDEFKGKFSDDKQGVERLRVACDKAKATLKNSSDAYLVSGWLYLQAKDRSQAEQDLNRAVSLNPKNEMAERLLAGAKVKKTRVIEKNGRKTLRLAPAS
ncbi:MAG: hypothetical protein KKE73_15945 [Proteobacteria bacterium]|nr:hypothetical protein [Pseudomonadota bacterium]